MSILGLHHITLVCSNAQQTIDFYVNVLGLRLVKKTVNFDDPSSYHLYFGDRTGRPGTAITFFEWSHAPKGSPGIGGTHHFALTVDSEDALRQWKRYLNDQGIKTKGIYDRTYFKSLYFKDPDGVNLEIATRGPGWTVDETPNKLGTEYRAPAPELLKANRDEDRIAAETWHDPVPNITPEMQLKDGMHHISAMSSNIERTHAFYSGLLGMRRLKMTDNFDVESSPHWYWGVGDGQPGTLITYFGYKPGGAPHVQMGVGQTHHFALAVADEETQLEWREKLIKAGLRVSPVMDRIYFKSIYTSDPDGHIVELATATPGFLADEELDSLGQGLMLPPWLEAYRTQIEVGLHPVEVVR